ESHLSLIAPSWCYRILGEHNICVLGHHLTAFVLGNTFLYISEGPKERESGLDTTFSLCGVRGVSGGDMNSFSKFRYTKKKLSDMGTEYLVRPVGRAEVEEDASDFEPEENGEDEDVDEEDEDDRDGKVEAPPKRKRSDKDDSGDDGGEDDERPPKR
ncbi:hypothetical protein Ancab_030073, partial [Ancistrocladus abbreviatus]